MLLLTSTSDKIQVVTGSAVTVDVHTSYMDYVGAASVTPGRTNSAITGATTTDIVGSPASGAQRNVKAIHISNKHASSSNLVTVQHTDGATVIELEKLTLLAGERLSYIEGQGFILYNAAGAVKPSLTTLTPVRLAADQSNSTTTATAVTGLTVAAPAGTYVFQYSILYQAAATTTGVKFSVNHTGTVSSLVANWYAVDNLAANASAAADQDALAAGGQVFFAFAARAKSTAGWGTSVSVDTANADMFAMVDGLVIVTADGNLELWHGSEVAAQSTVKAGSSLYLIKTG